MNNESLGCRRREGEKRHVFKRDGFPFRMESRWEWKNIPFKSFLIESCTLALPESVKLNINWERLGCWKARRTWQIKNTLSFINASRVCFCNHLMKKKLFGGRENLFQFAVRIALMHTQQLWADKRFLSTTFIVAGCYGLLCGLAKQWSNVKRSVEKCNEKSIIVLPFIRHKQVCFSPQLTFALHRMGE